MGKMRKVVILILISLPLWVFYWRLNTPGYLTFSDGAKIADIARNIVQGNGYGASFSSFGADKEILSHTRQFPFPAFGRQPMVSLVSALSFRLFGVSDLSVVLTSGLFYLLLVITTYLLGKKLYNELVGFLAGLAVAVNPNFLDYATSGASETLFTFEVVLAAYLLLSNNKKQQLLGFLVLVFSYFTRPQAFIFIWALILLYLLIKVKPLAKVARIMVIISLAGALIDLFILSKLTGKTFFYSVLSKGADVSVLYSPLVPATEGLRSMVDTKALLSSQFLALIKKTFYNLYNFYRLLPKIASPYMWALFIIGLFRWGKDRLINSFKLITLLLVLGLFLATAMAIPFFRYLHPVVPFVYLIAVATLVWIVESVVSVQWLVFSGWLKGRTPYTVHRTQALALMATTLILIFVVGQTIGVIFLDSRFKASIANKGKPPVYVKLSWFLKENTAPEDVVITNLDTWGSWYGERRTIWYPLKPEQLIPKKGEAIAFDAIYLTSYQIDDENYFMGPGWRQILNNPENPESEFISANFELKKVYQLDPKENYERQQASAVLLVRKGD